MILQNIKKNKGFVILFAVTISSILLAIALGVSNIALKEVKFGTSARETNNAFFAADTGIECALINDKAGGSLFVSSGSPVLNCNNTNISTVENTAGFWTFVIPGIGEDTQSCAKVTVDKTASPVTTVTSKGYNIGDVLCSSSNPDRIERELQTSYVGGGVPPPPPPPPASHFTVDTGGTLDNGLVSYWKLDEASGTRVDSKGGINLTSGLRVTQIIGEKVGNSAGFSGSPVLQSSSSALQTGDTSFTFAGWFRINSNYIQMPFGKTSTTASQREYRLQYHTSRRFDFEVYRPGGISSVTSTVPLSIGVWYFVVMWHDATTNIVGISVNNTATTSATGGSLQPASSAPFTLGTAVSATYDMTGRIDELGFWNRVLTAQERTDLYNSGTGSTYTP